MMSSRTMVVVGGGAAGFFGAISCAQAAPDARVVLLERGPAFLQKVRISGGGRCNVTHACFDAREMARRYPRGEKELIGLLQRFQARDTIEWFESRGVPLKTEKDGRMFPTTDSSQTIMDCLLHEARASNVELLTNCGADKIERRGEKFVVIPTVGAAIEADRVLLATGGCRTPVLGALATGLGHTLEPPVPSLFTFHIEKPWVRELADVSIPNVEASVENTTLRELGPILLTHWGLSGPVILRLSAWGARILHSLDYRFNLKINWVPAMTGETLRSELQNRIRFQPGKLVVNAPVAPLPGRLWEALVVAAQIPRERRWADLGRSGTHALVETLLQTSLPVTGKSLNKDEFVTCGGVRLNEIHLKTMESRLAPGLFFAGELLNLDGITGGFNFQAAWTTGWVAGRSMALADGR